MAAILKTFAGLNFYTRTYFIDYYHISFKKSHQTLRPRSCRVNQNFDISWILDLGLAEAHIISNICRFFIVLLVCGSLICITQRYSFYCLVDVTDHLLKFLKSYLFLLFY